MTAPINNAVAIYQHVTYVGQLNTCEYGPILLVEFYDDSLTVKPDGSVEISNGIPTRAWFEKNRRRLSRHHEASLDRVLSYYGL